MHLELRLRTGWWAPREVRFVVVSLRQLVGGVTIQEAKLEEAIRLTKNIYTIPLCWPENSAPGKRRHFGSLNVVVELKSHRFAYSC